MAAFRYTSRTGLPRMRTGRYESRVPSHAPARAICCQAALRAEIRHEHRDQLGVCSSDELPANRAILSVTSATENAAGCLLTLKNDLADLLYVRQGRKEKLYQVCDGRAVV